MQLDRTYGVLFGTTTQAGSFVTTVKTRFEDGSTKTSEFTTRVDADPQTLQYAARNIGVVGKATEIGPTTDASSSGTTYAIVCGELPKGLRLNRTTVVITGKVRNASQSHTIAIVAVTKGGALVTGAPMKITLRR